MCLLRMNLPNLCPNINHFNAVDFSECHSEEVMFLLTLSVYTGWPPKKRNGILPVMEVHNDWYQWMGYLLLRKMIPRSAILVRGFYSRAHYVRQSRGITKCGQIWSTLAVRFYLFFCWGGAPCVYMKSFIAKRVKRHF